MSSPRSKCTVIFYDNKLTSCSTFLILLKHRLWALIRTALLSTRNLYFKTEKGYIEYHCNPQFYHLKVCACVCVGGGGGRGCILYVVYINLELSRTMEFTFVSLHFTYVLELI